MKGIPMIGKVIQWALALLGIIFVVMIFNESEAGINGGLYVAYIAFGACAVLAILFGLYQLITGGRSSVPTLIGIGAFAVLIAISYAMSDGSVAPGQDVSESTSRLVGAGLGVLFILMGGAILAIFIGEISRLLK